MMRNILLASLLPLPLAAEIESDIKLGIEAVTGFRSGFVHRGFELAQTSLEFQMEAEFALSDESSLNFGLWHLAESDGDFSGSSAYLALSHRYSKKLTVGGSLTYRNLSDSPLDSGADIGLSAIYALNDDWEWSNELHYDLAAEGWYASTELGWSYPLSKSAFISVSTGVSVVSNYYDRDGLNDIFSRISLTYALSDSVAFTPFAGANFQLDDQEEDDVFYGGFWFEVIF